MAGTPSATGGTKSEPRTTIAAAAFCRGTQPFGQLVLYSAPGLTYWYSEIVTNFEINCGVHVYFESATSADLLQRLKAESRNPLADIVVAQPPYITTMADLDLLAPGPLSEAASVPAQRCDGQRRWCTVVDNFTSWVYNTKLLARAPTGYDDLLGSSFQNRLLTARADTTVDGLGLLALMTSQLGVDAALDTVGHLESNVAAHYISTDAMSHAVSNGSALAADGDLAEDLNDLGQYGQLGLWFPVVGGQPQALDLPFAAALVRGGRNRANARALLAYMWSVAGQSSVGAAYGSPARPDVTPTDARSQQVMSALSGVQVVRIDWEQLATEQPALTARWLALRKAPDGVPLPPAAMPGGSTTPTSLTP